MSIGAAFGVLVAVFQWGWLDSLFGVGATGPIESFLPVMLFAIVFGLSMDYQVFLVTRIHEEWVKTGDSKLAVRNGLAATGKTISAAALIMILVFGSFILGGEIVIKEFGLGLAGGILVDAIVIRMAVVPAVLTLLGRSTWWFPRLARSHPAELRVRGQRTIGCRQRHDNRLKRATSDTTTCSIRSTRRRIRRRRRTSPKLNGAKI